MGSSRKHGKDRERGTKDRDSRKRRRRSRSRERDQSISHRDGQTTTTTSSSSGGRHGHGGCGRSAEVRSSRDSRTSSSSKRSRGSNDGQQRFTDRDESSRTAEDSEPIRSKSGGGGGDVSLSIDETNKLRAKLGLKPLESKDGSSAAVSTKKETGDTKKDEFVHRPAESLTDRRFVEKMREKIAVQKQKREFLKKLGKVKGIADSDSEEEDATNWVLKTRQIETEKRKAEERAKMLEEMDAEFGIGNLVENEFRQIKGQAYSAKDLRGLTVQHAQSSFTEGKVAILTLKDKGVLDEDEGDVLVNVNIVDEERAAKNVEIKKGKPTYNPYDDDDIDDYGRVIDKSLLSKYDEEIDGEQKKSFTIGSSGAVRTESERDLVRQKLLQKQGEVSLDMPALKVANEYYTDEEMAKFKKPTKFRKVRKKVKPLKADELLGMRGDATPTGHKAYDLGSRNQRNYRQAVPVQKNFKHPWETEEDSRDDTDAEDDDVDADDFEPDEALGVEPDDAEMELRLALNKARRLKQTDERRAGRGSNRFLGTVEVKREVDDGGDEDADDGKGFIVLNSTAEFCRALGDIPTYGMSGNRDDDDVDDLADYDEGMYGDGKIRGDDRTADGRDVVDGDDEDDGGYREGWNEVKPNANPAAKVKKEDVTILDEEPDVGTGVAGALQLAMKKGYLEQEVKKVVSAPRHTTLEAASYTIEDKNFMEDDRQGRRERYATGPVTDFRDKDNYRPEVKLEYIDDGGRLLTPKEAFRYLSHKFHGKGSGKNKTEKRMKKVQEESLMKQMSSTDTPLGTLALLQDKQKQTQSPYIVLSGGNKAINPSIISKTK